MKIAFWCKDPNSLLISAGVAAVAYSTSAVYGHRSIVFHAGFNCYELEHAFVEHADTLLIREELAYFYDSGIDLVLNRLRFEGLGVTGIREQLLEVKKGLLYYLPGSTKSNKEVYEEMLKEKGKEAFGLLEEMSEILFIACGGDVNTNINRLVFETADLIVIMCSQIPPYNREVYDELKEFGSKTMYLAGMYDNKSKFLIKDIRKALKLKKDEVCIIPYNIGFQDALCDGSMVAFMDKANKSTKKEGVNHFVREVKKTTRMILQKAGLYEKEE